MRCHLCLSACITTQNTKHVSYVSCPNRVLSFGHTYSGETHSHGSEVSPSWCIHQVSQVGLCQNTKHKASDCQLGASSPNHLHFNEEQPLSQSSSKLVHPPREAGRPENKSDKSDPDPAWGMGVGVISFRHTYSEGRSSE